MSQPTRSPNLRALTELYEMTVKRCKKAYHDQSYGCEFGLISTAETKELISEQSRIRAIVSKEIEEWHYKALQAIATREALPPIPDFEMRE